MSTTKSKFLGVLLCLLVLNGCSELNMGMSFFRSAEDFVPLKNDGRIRYELGAEDFAVRIQPYLDEAIATVEAAHYRKFPKAVQVQVCASTQRFSVLSGGSPKANGEVHPTNGLLLNANLFDTPELINAVLTHELSHELMRQQLGSRYYASVPVWFNEGFAELVTNGSQLAKVSESEARDLILAGRIIQASDTGSLLSYDTTESFGDLAYPRYVFYREGMMFVAWLKQHDEEKFKMFLSSIQDGTSFRDAFIEAFGGDVKTLQIKFVQSLKER